MCQTAIYFYLQFPVTISIFQETFVTVFISSLTASRHGNIKTFYTILLSYNL